MQDYDRFVPSFNDDDWYDFCYGDPLNDLDQEIIEDHNVNNNSDDNDQKPPLDIQTDPNQIIQFNNIIDAKQFIVNHHLHNRYLLCINAYDHGILRTDKRKKPIPGLLISKDIINP